MKISILSFTLKGDALGGELAKKLRQAGHQTQHTDSSQKVGVHHWTQNNFSTEDGLIYIGAAGIAVRALAPHLVSKTSDPAVLVLDQEGEYVIPLLSGHLGGANELGVEVATLLGGTPVITTATDLQQVFAVDSWAGKENLAILNPEGIVDISSPLLKGEKVYLNTPFPFTGTLPQGVVQGEGQPEILVDIYESWGPSSLQLVPKILTLGVGCRQGVTLNQVEDLFFQILKEQGLQVEAFAGMASIELKGQEPALLAFSKKYALPFQTHSTQDLIKTEGSVSPSAFVAEKVGVDNVCERSALYGGGKKLLMAKTALNGVTMAIGQDKDYHLRF